jgi:septal ring factor EnvC (AmiA/AmiB activator)
MVDQDLLVKGLSAVVAGALVAWSIVKLWLTGKQEELKALQSRVGDHETKIARLEAEQGTIGKGIGKIEDQLTAMHTRLDHFTEKIGLLVGEMRAWRGHNE